MTEEQERWKQRRGALLGPLVLLAQLLIVGLVLFGGWITARFVGCVLDSQTIPGGYVEVAIPPDGLPRTSDGLMICHARGLEP